MLYLAEQLKIPIVEVAVKWTEIEGRLSFGCFFLCDICPM